jgi:very-short-patch-repair endonuclease
LDFYFPKQKTNLEIDGNQHKYRKESDIKRDNLLKSIGINVQRIPWVNLKDEKEKDFFIKSLLSFIYDLK